MNRGVTARQRRRPRVTWFMAEASETRALPAAALVPSPAPCAEKRIDCRRSRSLLSSARLKPLKCCDGGPEQFLVWCSSICLAVLEIALHHAVHDLRYGRGHREKDWRQQVHTLFQRANRCIGLPGFCIQIAHNPERAGEIDAEGVGVQSGEGAVVPHRLLGGR